MTPVPDADVTCLQADDETRLANPHELGQRSTAARDNENSRSSNSLLRVGDPFGTRYRILRLLGAGGMGVVYHAWDEELGEAVALKLIRPEVAGDPAAARDLEARFRRELLLARKVSHRNVVRIHDMGEIDGTKYISMAFVEGRDLATVLKTTGHLPVNRVVHFIKQLAAGLAEAHREGVIHRDLKPANIMVEGDDLRIMDFGIARSSLSPVAQGTTAAKSWSKEALITGATMQGAIVGTMAYMSPEQAKGEAVDERSDIYSLGMVMRDMLVGLRQTDSPTDAINDLLARIDNPPKPVQSIDPTIPDAVDRIVTRCLQPDRTKRFASVQELLAALEGLDTQPKSVSRPRPVNRLLIAALVLLPLALSVGTWWLTRTPAPAAEPEPVSVVIADFRNATGDPAFDGTLEPMLRLALEDAGFITAFDRTSIRTLGVRPPDSLDERAAQELAANQGLRVILAGAVEPSGGGYAVSLKALYAVTGNVIADLRETAANKTQVLAAATTLASDLRDALGDETPEADRRFAMETLSATSIDVVREYAAAANAMSNSRFDVALEHFAKSVALDPEFGLGHAGLAIASRNLDRQQDAEKYITEAVRHVDGMTERERYRTRGLYYMITGDPRQCVKEFGDLIERFAADASARNNLALCATYLRDMPRAVEEMRKVIAILPKRALYRENLALYAAYSGDADVAESEARAVPEPGLFSQLAVAFSQLLKGDLASAAATYQGLSRFDGLGTSYSASGLGDLALYEGRLSEAAAIFAKGATADVDAKEADRAANKYAALAYTELLRGNRAAAVAAADRALEQSTAVKIRFLTGRVFTEAGAADKARAQREALAAGLLIQPTTYAKILEGLAALGSGDARGAIGSLNEANALLDTWIGHFDLGRAYLEAGAFTQADSEFDRAIARRGEALSLFLDEEPTFGFFPPVYYYQGRVREGLKSAGFSESYRRYLEIRGESSEDPLVADARRRAGG